MSPLEMLLMELAGSIPDGAGSAAEGVRVEVGSAELSLPIESRLGQDGALYACTPRGRQATGFDAPLGRLRISLLRGAP
ncbi:MAG TPA: hypothetical protein VM684_11645 [Gaiellales bacterium]|jgi:hypothetical protein|nr:hypothetical protein [Gaiellales bacterium]HZX94940.1 hypothetical protein [Myxococcales bacterium]